MTYQAPAALAVFSTGTTVLFQHPNGTILKGIAARRTGPQRQLVEVPTYADRNGEYDMVAFTLPVDRLAKVTTAPFAEDPENIFRWNGDVHGAPQSLYNGA